MSKRNMSVSVIFSVCLFHSQLHFIHSSKNRNYPVHCLAIIVCIVGETTNDNQNKNE